MSIRANASAQHVALGLAFAWRGLWWAAAEAEQSLWLVSGNVYGLFLPSKSFRDTQTSPYRAAKVRPDRPTSACAKRENVFANESGASMHLWIALQFSDWLRSQPANLCAIPMEVAHENELMHERATGDKCKPSLLHHRLPTILLVGETIRSGNKTERSGPKIKWNSPNAFKGTMNFIIYVQQQREPTAASPAS